MATTITPESLTPESPIKIPTPTVDTTNYSGIVSGVTDSLANEYNALNQQLNQAQQAQKTSASDITSLMNELSGKTGYTQAAQEQAGVQTETANLNKLAEQLAGLNAQATTLQREAQAIPIQVQQESAGLGRTDVGVAPITTGRLRENALKALSLAQQSDIATAAITGSQLRLQAAKDKAQQIVDLKYQPLENALAVRKQQYELNKDYLTTLDKKRAEALSVALNREEKAIAEKKANEKAISDMVTNASIYGAPIGLLNSAKNAKSSTEAAMILGQYAGDYYKTELLKQQIATEKAQRAKVYADIEKAKSEIAAKLNTTPAVAQQKIQSSQEVLNLANELLTLPGKSAAVGVGFKKTIVSALPFVGPEAIPGTERVNYEAKVAQLKDLLASANLDKLKGAMSDKDIEFLRNTASALNLDMNEKQFDTELNKIKAKMSAVPGVSTSQTGLEDVLNSVDTVYSGSAPTTLSGYASSFTRK